MNHRVLGILGMLGAPMMAVEGFLRSNNGSSNLIALIEFLYLAGWGCGAVGLRQLRVTGEKSGKVILAIQLLGLTMAALFTFQETFGPKTIQQSPFFGITDAAWPLSHLFMLIVGIAVIKARVWRDWRKWTPFIPPLGLILGMALGAISRNSMLITFPLLTTLGFGLLGYAVYCGNNTIRTEPQE